MQTRSLLPPFFFTVSDTLEPYQFYYAPPHYLLVFASTVSLLLAAKNYYIVITVMECCFFATVCRTIQTEAIIIHCAGDTTTQVCHYRDHGHKTSCTHDIV